MAEIKLDDKGYYKEVEPAESFESVQAMKQYLLQNNFSVIPCTDEEARGEIELIYDCEREENGENFLAVVKLPKPNGFVTALIHFYQVSLIDVWEIAANLCDLGPGIVKCVFIRRITEKENPLDDAWLITEDRGVSCSLRDLDVFVV